ncbi:hypothetical protein PILCRDRAFT_73177 [Piloderma croceum F 1598]|uniref:MARVEL domain-containing protein n=1 Tax=Piloderma croceum (strain F 1598) TaxID=765440 RepID=A0A0C3F6W5_PILCF|nr:hypothetical protein PILCRDRAFT_73177 [Piloderma croceum F 1598]
MNGSKHFSNLISGVIAAVTSVLAVFYFCSLGFLYRNAQQHPRTFKNKTGLRLQRYGPGFYAFLVGSSLAEIGLASWLLLQYHHNNNSPSSSARNGVRIVLFNACWTAVTAVLYAAFFLHPSWSQQSIASIGAQATWLLLTWILWVSGASMLNTALPSLFTGDTCITVVYCGQLQSLFALSVLEIFTLTIGMLAIVWLAWLSTRHILHTKTLPY